MLVPGLKSIKSQNVISQFLAEYGVCFYSKDTKCLGWAMRILWKRSFSAYKYFTLTLQIFSEKTMLHYLAKNCLYFRAFCVFNGLICSSDGNPLVGSYKISISHISPISFKWNIPFYSFLLFSHPLIWSVHGK